MRKQAAADCALGKSILNRRSSGALLPDMEISTDKARYFLKDAFGYFR